VIEVSLTPGKRVTLIKRTAQALADDAWTDIDMILRTFEVPDIDHPGGTPDASTAPAAESIRLLPMTQ
jgi:hypothetical protein